MNRRFLMMQGRRFARVITPTLGAELVSNGDMETGSPPTGWTALASAALASVEDERTGGAGSKSIGVTHNGTSNPGGRVAVTTVAGAWYQLIWWRKNIDASHTNGYLLKSDGSVVIVTFPSNTSTSWVRQLGTGHAGNWTASAVWCFAITSTLARSGRFDDVSVKQITGVLGTRNFTTSTGDCIVKAKVKVTALTQIGFWINVDDPSNPQNGVACHVDGAKVYLERIVGGVWQTANISATQAWTDWDELKVIKTGTTYQVYRNSVQVGTDQTISDAGVINNNNHRQFSTYAGNEFQTFQVLPNP